MWGLVTEPKATAFKRACTFYHQAAGKRWRWWEASGRAGRRRCSSCCSSFTSPRRAQSTLHGVDSATHAAPQRAWRKKLIYLEQSAPLLHRTVRENIAMGRYGDGVTIRRTRRSSGRRRRRARTDFIHRTAAGLRHADGRRTGKTCPAGSASASPSRGRFWRSADFLLLDEPTVRSGTPKVPAGGVEIAAEA